MVKINRIYTRTGDKGETGLGDGSRRRKDDARVAAYGEVDELNASIGVALVGVERAGPEAADAVGRRLLAIQNDLFDLGADLCVPIAPGEEPGAALRVTAGQVDRLERGIDELNAGLGALTSFVLPGGSELSARLHVARTVCRRAERAVATLLAAEPETTAPEPLRYLNRLADLLFVLARVANAWGEADVLWTPGAGRDDDPRESEA